MGILEIYYGNALRNVLKIINPFKKTIIKTEAKVHQFINFYAVSILEKNNYTVEFNYYKEVIDILNKGAVWADQDFKSINHFYNPVKKRGLYGHGNALKLSKKYYNLAIEKYKNGDVENSIFYLGSCVHIIQDLTIPQHVNIKLLDNHRQYENFVKTVYNKVNEFKTYDKPIVFNNIEKYINFNAKVALRIHKKFKHIQDDNLRFYKVTNCSLPLAQRTTAGCLIMFYKDINRLNVKV